VPTVNVAVALPAAANVRLAGFRVHVGRFCAPVGELVSAQVRFSVPLYVLPASTVSVAVPVPPAEIPEGDVGDMARDATVTDVVAAVVL